MTERGGSPPPGSPEPGGPVDRLLGAIERGIPAPPGVFAADATLDATVPHWRFSRHGESAVLETLSEWYRDRGRFESLSRTPLPAGELVEFTLAWEEGGVAHGAHQIHVLHLYDGRIVADTVFCGGRWPAPLLAEMEMGEREAGAAGCAWTPASTSFRTATHGPAG